MGRLITLKILGYFRHKRSKSRTPEHWWWGTICHKHLNKTTITIKTINLIRRASIWLTALRFWRLTNLICSILGRRLSCGHRRSLDLLCNNMLFTEPLSNNRICWNGSLNRKSIIKIARTTCLRSTTKSWTKLSERTLTRTTSLISSNW